MSFYRRRLPHWQPEGKPLFLTFNLYGAIPRDRYPPAALSGGKAFVWLDRYLDEARTGPTWRKQPEIAKIVRDAIFFAETQLRYYELEAWAIMANHVHMLVCPFTEASRFMRSVKSFSAKEANNLLGRAGEPFWQPESYDHWVRNDEEFHRIVAYIENNPVRAGLVAAPEDCPWSSAARPAGAPAPRVIGPRHVKTPA